MAQGEKEEHQHLSDYGKKEGGEGIRQHNLRATCNFFFLPTMRLAGGAEVERLADGFKIRILFATSSTMAQNQGEKDAITVPPVKTNNGAAGECAAADIYHLPRGMFSSFVLV